ncbi:hypothetical protein IE02_2388 [Fibrobacter succinogenes subsp. elongatus]|uniref:Uncharacterized protein n=2 Tax=Fibrobacter succinogenes TaxID=833 RepID=A0A380S7U2_FIBSU|nr:hypothetical protein IE02_2388 [Fibrobacter succinogenes subsp. elongatus]SUQ24974.1 hypothetical protein SAMN05661053_2388 [Fibrobacter succinogenes]
MEVVSMKNKVWILFDCPDESNDKKWLIEELYKLHGGNVYSVSIHKTLWKLFVENALQKIYAHLIVLWQCVRAMALSSKDDVFITWNPRNGLYLNAMLRLLNRKNRLISMNWLSPAPNILKRKKLIKWMFENPNARIIMNSPESVSDWNRCIGLKESDVTVIPDVYDNDTVFHKRELWEKYCFTGGFNNRDWNVVRNLALHFSAINFICVAHKEDFEKNIEDKSLPSNMIVHYDIAPEKYYELMRQAFVVLLPFRDKRVAGLINILKSASYGIPCMITKTASTEQYYEPNSPLLIGNGNWQIWKDSLKDLLEMEKESYEKLCADFSGYIQENFSPQIAAKRIYQNCVLDNH